MGCKQFKNNRTLKTFRYTGIYTDYTLCADCKCYLTTNWTMTTSSHYCLILAWQEMNGLDYASYHLVLLFLATASVRYMLSKTDPLQLMRRRYLNLSYLYLVLHIFNILIRVKCSTKFKTEELCRISVPHHTVRDRPRSLCLLNNVLANCWKIQTARKFSKWDPLYLLISTVMAKLEYKGNVTLTIPARTTSWESSTPNM